MWMDGAVVRWFFQDLDKTWIRHGVVWSDGVDELVDL